MSAGIRVEGCRDIRLIGNSISGFDNAYEIVDSTVVELRDSDFTGKVVVDRVKGFSAVGNEQHEPTKFRPRLRSLMDPRVRVPPVWRRFELTPRVYQLLYGVLPDGNVRD